MTESEARDAVFARWWALAAEALASARDDVAAGRLHSAVNRAYYACFYAATAVFFAEGREFAKHTGVQTAVHRDLVRTGRLEPAWGQLFNTLFDARQSGDYQAITEFEQGKVQAWVQGAEELVARFQALQPEGRTS